MQSMVPIEIIATKIYLIRGQKVMLDRDLAELYGVETKYLKRQVNRNRLRFPDDFMFELTKEELANWRRQFGTSNSERNRVAMFFLPLPREGARGAEGCPRPNASGIILVMRLSPIEREALQYALEGVADSVYLFGSRVDASKKGGDIDLLIYSKAEPLQLSMQVSTRFFSKCEEKIDVLVVDADNLSAEQTTFLSTLNLVPLKL